MRATGYVRSVDSMGRLVIPKFLRRVYGLDAGKYVEIDVDGDKMIIKLCRKDDHRVEEKGIA